VIKALAGNGILIGQVGKMHGINPITMGVNESSKVYQLPSYGPHWLGSNKVPEHTDGLTNIQVHFPCWRILTYICIYQIKDITERKTQQLNFIDGIFKGLRCEDRQLELFSQVLQRVPFHCLQLYAVPITITPLFFSLRAFFRK
jgi:hypothetical protein